MWGKNEGRSIKFDDNKRHSLPYQICPDVRVQAISVGIDHMVMIDAYNQLWGVGDNTNGCLGVGGDKFRINPQRAVFFETKRVIDIACGDSFSVIIAESFKITSKKQKNIFDNLR